MSTIKQKKAAKLIKSYTVEGIKNGDSVSIEKILREAGYSPKSARQSTKLINADGFKNAVAEEFRQLLPDIIEAEKRLVNIMNEILNQNNTDIQNLDKYTRALQVLHTIKRLESDQSTANEALQIIRQDFAKEDL